MSSRVSTEKNIQLAKELVQLYGFTFTRGMKTIPITGYNLPDLNDGATKGALIELVRELSNDQFFHIEAHAPSPLPKEGEGFWIPWLVGFNLRDSPSEAEALIDAFKALSLYLKKQKDKSEEEL